MDKKTKIIWKPIDELIPYEHNAKEHNITQIENIAKSIEKYGWQSPILIDGNNMIVAGHGRIEAAKTLGLKDCPCIIAEGLTEEQIREYRILDNKLNESEWIDEELEFELPELDFSDFDLVFDGDLENETTEKTKERKDINYTESISIVIDCKDEIEAETIYEKLTEEGYECRVSTL